METFIKELIEDIKETCEKNPKDIGTLKELNIKIGILANLMTIHQVRSMENIMDITGNVLKDFHFDESALNLKGGFNIV